MKTCLNVTSCSSYGRSTKEPSLWVFLLGDSVGMFVGPEKDAVTHFRATLWQRELLCVLFELRLLSAPLRVYRQCVGYGGVAMMS